jgi:hypothetical protein
VDPNPIEITKNGSGAVYVTIGNFSGNMTITATPGNSGVIQVAPTTKTVTATNGTARATFVIIVKSKSDNVVFSSSCGSKTLDVTVK